MDPSADGNERPRHKTGDRAAHDLYTPLTIIKGQAQLLRRWVEKHTDPDNDVAIARLDVIDGMVMRIATEIESVRTTKEDPWLGDPQKDES